MNETKLPDCGSCINSKTCKEKRNLMFIKNCAEFIGYPFSVAIYCESFGRCCGLEGGEKDGSRS